jgi:hypothetical protein
LPIHLLLAHETVMNGTGKSRDDRKRRLRQWVAEITVMGGSTGNGNVTGAAEWNIQCAGETGKE